MKSLKKGSPARLPVKQGKGNKKACLKTFTLTRKKFAKTGGNRKPL